MLDYEILGYYVYYVEKGSCYESTRNFGTEEEAVAFIKKFRHKWDEYRIIKRQAAIIDF